ncbi:low temperature requirement protein A [Amycolatopsis sp. NPDC049252]|uniref:low temperature requirement protein A n=1 Tax=Amycolatopsis sp. NPDC049252 TaxID=3363933 RepID=UPI0037111917
MSEPDEALKRDLRDDLRHRLRPMPARDAGDTSRSTAPLELLYDLTYVIAFAGAAEQLAHHLVAGAPLPAIGAYLFAIFAVTWAWLNFTWLTSAYGNDDALFRVATIAQMAGVVVLTFGLPAGFSAVEEGHSPLNTLVIVGYLVMRVPLVLLWLRAAREDAGNRRICVAYGCTIAAAQACWILVAVLPMPFPATVLLLVVLALAEMAAPVLLERRLGNAPWNAGHLAERFGLLTLITLGEVIAATTVTVGTLVQENGWSVAAVMIIAAGLAIASALWWAYFQIPSRAILIRWPRRVFAWRYANFPLFGAIAAVGAGLRVAAAAVQEEKLSLFQVALCLAVPVAVALVTIFVTWSVLMHAYDLTHVPLFLASLSPVAAAVVVGAVLGRDEPLDLTHGHGLTGLVLVVSLIALGTVVEVVGHEVVGFRHTLRAVGGDQPEVQPDGA